jgi:hypothetical protein
MAASTTAASQQRAARVAGFMYLLMIAGGVFSDFVVRAKIGLPGNAAGNMADTVRRIMDVERLFRIGILTDLLTVASGVVLAVALYRLLTPVDKSLALVATFWQLTACAILGVVALRSFVALLVVNSPESVQAFTTDQRQALAGLAMRTHDAGYRLAGIPAALGSGLACYLFYRSRYIPRLLSGWGLFAWSVLLALMVAVALVPNFLLYGRLWPTNLFIIAFELTTGLWLLFKGVELPRG